VSLAFDRSPWFSFDKAANEACRRLESTNRCAIHGDLRVAGHAGCASYDCYGAGQRVTQELFPGVAWRDDPKRARALFEAFRRLRDLHELRLLLHETERLPLPLAAFEHRAKLLAKLEPRAGFSATTLAALDLCALDNAVHAYLRSLRAYLPQPTAARRRLPLVG
jgi:hypothetical protein